MAARVIVTESSSYAFIIPTNKWLVGWEIRGDSSQTVSVGWTVSGTELSEPTDLLANQPHVGSANSHSTNSSYTIYFSGMEGTNTIQLWLLG